MLPLDVASDEVMLLLLCWAYWLLLDCKAGKTVEQLVKNPSASSLQNLSDHCGKWQVRFWE